MNRYEIETAKLEARTPLFYYPYNVELKSKYAKEQMALHLREDGPLRAITQKDLALVNDENMKKLSGRYVFHYNDPKETEATRISYVREGAISGLGRSGISLFKQLLPNVRNYGPQLEVGKDFEIIVGERVEIEQPVKLTLNDIPDLMGINEDESLSK